MAGVVGGTVEHRPGSTLERRPDLDHRRCLDWCLEVDVVGDRGVARREIEPDAVEELARHRHRAGYRKHDVDHAVRQCADGPPLDGILLLRGRGKHVLAQLLAGVLQQAPPGGRFREDLDAADLGRGGHEALDQEFIDEIVVAAGGQGAGRDGDADLEGGRERAQGLCRCGQRDQRRHNGETERGAEACEKPPRTPTGRPHPSDSCPGK